MGTQESLEFWPKLKATIEKVCKDCDVQWQSRKRVLSTYFLVLFIFKLVLNKHKQGYASMLCELWDSVDSKLLDLPQKHPVAASSICEARQKMPETVFQKINDELLLQWHKIKFTPAWRGHRIFAVDGSRLNLPRELIKDGYNICDEKYRHYPTGLLSVLYNLNEGMVYDTILDRHMDERTCAIDHMDKMLSGDVLILDRGYFSYLLLFRSVEKGIRLICRIQSGSVNGEIKKILDSSKTDATINYYPSEIVKADLKKRGFNLKFKKIPLRIIKYTIDKEIYICATTLVEKRYPAKEFSKLYHGRWGIEELYKISKHFVDIESFHSKSERGVKQEIYAHLLLINIAKIFESDANEKIKKSPEDNKPTDLRDGYWRGFQDSLLGIKINFKNCLLVVSRYLERLFLTSVGVISKWLPDIITAITRVKQKIRTGRHYPRVSFKPMSRWLRNRYLRTKNKAVYA